MLVFALRFLCEKEKEREREEDSLHFAGSTACSLSL